jgi:hypothetical protein
LPLDFWEQLWNLYENFTGAVRSLSLQCISVECNTPDRFEDKAMSDRPTHFKVNRLKHLYPRKSCAIAIRKSRLMHRFNLGPKACLTSKLPSFLLQSLEQQNQPHPLMNQCACTGPVAVQHRSLAASFPVRSHRLHPIPQILRWC